MAIIKNPLTIVQTGTIDSGGKYLVQVIDYDGTVLKSDHLNTGATFTLPDSPTHDKLVFQQWSSPVTITNNTVTVGNSDITIGAVYNTASGLTEFDIVLTKATGLSVTCNMVGNKNWGDGTTDSATTHTYTDYGSYTITCDGTSLTTYVFGQSSSAPNYYCINIRLMASFVTSYSFSYCYSVKTTTLRSSTSNIAANAFTYNKSLFSIIFPSNTLLTEIPSFNNCDRLSLVVIPHTITEIGSFSNCISLRNISIPDSVIDMRTDAFYGCSSLSRVTLPNNLTSILTQAFRECSSLTELVFPSSLTSIGNSAFNGNYGMRKYDFTLATTVPILGDISPFGLINGLCKIYVPDSLYDQWITATNWVAYADYIYKASEMNA